MQHNDRIGLRYGVYGNKQMILGPNSSRMIESGSVFVEEVRVMTENENGLMIYGFDKLPELSVETNWSVSVHLYLDSYGCQGISLWLNRGSRIWMEWELAKGNGNSEDMLVVLSKGEDQYMNELDRFQSTFSVILSDLSDGTTELEYRINEDDTYYIGILNLSPRSMAAALKLNISSKVHDTREATSICSTGNGTCKLRLSFSCTQYFVLTTPNGDVTMMKWQVQFSFAARSASFLVIIGCLVAVISLLLRCFGVSESYGAIEETTIERTEPILSEKKLTHTYRTNEGDLTSNLSVYTKSLDEDEICAICYDRLRDCFFTPCGHIISCYTCAQRIVEDTKVCPICRRFVHKVKKINTKKEGGIAK